MLHKLPVDDEARLRLSALPRKSNYEHLRPTRTMPASAKHADDVIEACNRAVAANQSLPIRHGNLVVITQESADDVFVVSDLHGNRCNFEKLLEKADLENHPRRHLIMQEVCHGGPTYPSGTGCMSHLLLEDTARLKARYADRFHFIQSNHEMAELTDYPIVKGGRMLNLLFRAGIQQMYGAQSNRVRDAYLDFLKSLPLAVRLGNGIFISHSIPEINDQNPFDASVFERTLNSADLSEGGDAFRLVWGRDYRAENAQRFAELVDARVLVTGHEPCGDGFEVPNPHQIILDTQADNGCYVILPVAEEQSQQQVVDRIERLN